MTELDPQNGTALVGDNDLSITVEASKIGEDAQTASFINNIDTTQVQVQKVWTDDGKTGVDHSGDSIVYKIHRTPYRMVDDPDNPGEQIRVEYTKQEVTTAIVPTMTGFTGTLEYNAQSPADSWKETVEQLPKTGVEQDGSEVVLVSYEYYVTEETVIDGYKTLISGGEITEGDNAGDYSYTITNEPLGPTDQQTTLNVKKVWNTADGNEDTDLHKSDSIVFNVTQKKYVARVTYKDGNQTVSNVLYPIMVILKDEKGVPGSGHVTNEELSTVVYVPAGAEFNITPIEANPTGVTNPYDHFVEGYGFGPGAASINHRSGETYTIDHVNSAIEITLDLHAGNDRWYSSLADDERDYHKWTYSMYSPQGIIWHLEELQEKVLENIEQNDGTPEMAAGYPVTFNYTMSLTNTEGNDSGLPTVIENGTNAPGHGAGSANATWEGGITDLPLYEYKENENDPGLGGLSYIYMYEVEEAAIGSSTVGPTNQPGGWKGETSAYFVTWQQDEDKNSPTYGLWTLTNQAKPTIDVSIHKVDEDNVESGTPLLPGAKFKLVKYTSLNPKTKDTAWGTNGESDEVSENPQNPGVFTFEGLGAGYYEIVETKYPDGYVKSGDNPVFLVRANPNMEAVLVYTSGEHVGDPITGNATDTVRIDNTTMVGNEPGVALPITGGMGVEPIVAFGGILIALAAAILVIGRRRTTM